MDRLENWKKAATLIQAWDFRPGTNFVLEIQNAGDHSNTVEESSAPAEHS
jgi:hypothetical protein